MDEITDGIRRSLNTAVEVAQLALRDLGTSGSPPVELINRASTAANHALILAVIPDLAQAAGLTPMEYMEQLAVEGLSQDGSALSAVPNGPGPAMSLAEWEEIAAAMEADEARADWVRD